MLFRTFTLMILLASLVFLNACGQMGDLTLPLEKPNAYPSLF